MYMNRLMCCGIMEIGALSTYSKGDAAIKAFHEEVYKKSGNGYDNRSHDGRGHINKLFRYALFSQAGLRTAYGTRFAAYILKHKLGSVVETDFNANPNSGNPVKAWLWTVNHEAVQEHVTKLLKVEAPPNG